MRLFEQRLRTGTISYYLFFTIIIISILSGCTRNQDSNQEANQSDSSYYYLETDTFVMGVLFVSQNDSLIEIEAAAWDIIYDKFLKLSLNKGIKLLEAKSSDTLSIQVKNFYRSDSTPVMITKDKSSIHWMMNPQNEFADWIYCEDCILNIQ